MSAIFTDLELLYAATARCKCGAGVAYPLDHTASMELRAWLCASVLRGEVPEEHYSEHESFPWAMWKVREETSINNHGAHTTRPPGTVAKTVGSAVCGACQHQWESEPYVACGLGHHWDCGPCPKFGNDCGAGLVHHSSDKRPRIESRYRDVVFPLRAHPQQEKGE